MVSPTHPHARAPWRDRLSAVIFGTDTRAGRAFDMALIVLILLSAAVVMTDSIPSVSERWHREFTLLEWFFTALFTVEYIARLACAREPLRYATSFLAWWTCWRYYLPTWRCCCPKPMR